MKKHIALFLAAALTVSALPMSSVLAKTANSIDTTYVVAVDHKFEDADKAPKLILQNDKHTPIRAGEKFRLVLTNAEWNVSADELKAELEKASEKVLKEDGQPDVTTRNRYEVTMISKTEAEITFVNVLTLNPSFDPEQPESDTNVYGTPMYDAGKTINDEDLQIIVPMLTEITAEGDAVVKIDASGSYVSPGDYVFATASSGKTVTTASKTVNISEAGTELGNIVINETAIGAMNGEKTVTVKAPANFKFTENKDQDLVTYAGDYAGLKDQGYLTEVSGYGTNELKITFYKMVQRMNADGTPAKDSEGQDIFDRVEGLPKSTSKATVVFNGLILNPDDDAKFGDVNLTVSGSKVTKQQVLVGEYKDYGLTFKAEDKELPVILAGRISGNTNNSDATEQDDVATLQMHVKETLANSLFGKRITKITVPDGVEIRGAEIGYNKSNTSVVLDSSNESDKLSGGNFSGGEVILKDNEIQFRNVETNGKASEMYVKLYVSAEAGYAGEVVATLSGGGMSEELEATIAKVESPVNVTTAQTQLNIGFKDVTVNDITISETQAGAIRKQVSVTDDKGATSKQNAAMTLQIDDGDVIKYHSVDSYEVTDGDISIDKVRVVNGKIQMTLKSESDVPSTIVLKGIKTTVDRTPATGNYDLNLAGSAILNNYDEKSNVNGYFDTEYFTVEKAYRVATQDDKNVYVQLTVDSNKMVVGSGEIEMDVAPYINSNGRTMLPIRYVANAFGINADQINWNPDTKTVTIVTDSKVVQFETGSTVMISNGTRIQMDTAIENKDGRTFIPVSWLAVGLGLEKPEWNEANRTVTFNPENAPNA